MNARIIGPPRQFAPRTFTPVRSGLLQRKCACGGTPGPTGECEGCRKKREARRLQRKTRNSEPGTRNDSGVPPIVYEVLRSPGQPLDTKARAFMEPRFGHDFSKVRIHTDTRASESARVVHSLAYTVGRQVVFAAGQYGLGTTSGRQLLAHELTHTIQQSSNMQGLQEELRTTASDDMAEREAEAASRTIAHGQPFIARSREAVKIARQTDAGVPDAPDPNRNAQVECVKRLGGCPNTRPAGIPTPEEIARYNEECRRDTGYTGPDLTPTDEECSQSSPPAPPTPATPFQVCARALQVSPYGNHAYIEAPPFRYAIISPTCPVNWYDNPITGTGGQKWDNSKDPCGKSPTCIDCLPAPGVTDVARCLRAAFTAYNNPSFYKILGPNSNTFAGTLARTCCAGMVPKPAALGWVPGWDDAPAPSHPTPPEGCPPGPTC